MNMDDLSRQYYTDIKSGDADKRYEGYSYLIKETQEPVTWAYEVWDELISLSSGGDNHERSIAGQLLVNLAKSDPERRIVRDIDKIMAVTKDERFVTARHVLQSVWKIGVIDKELQALVEQKLSTRYEEAANEKNRTLIRFDIIENYRKMFDQFRDPLVKEKALALIAKEPDERYQRKFMGVWKHS